MPRTHDARYTRRLMIIAPGVLLSGALLWFTQPAAADVADFQKKALFSRWIAPPEVETPSAGSAGADDADTAAGRAEDLAVRADDLVFDEVDLVDRFLVDDPPEPSLQAAQPRNAPDASAALKQNDLSDPVRASIITEVPAWPSEPRVVLHAAARSTPLASFFMDELASRADISLEKRQVDVDVSTSHLRYFYPGDASKAADLALALGTVEAPLVVKDFTHFRPKPHRGLIEVWVQGPGSD